MMFQLMNIKMGIWGGRTRVSLQQSGPGKKKNFFNKKHTRFFIHSFFSSSKLSTHTFMHAPPTRL